MLYFFCNVFYDIFNVPIFNLKILNVLNVPINAINEHYFIFIYNCLKYFFAKMTAITVKSSTIKYKIRINIS
jgi:hypothetical protein